MIFSYFFFLYNYEKTVAKEVKTKKCVRARLLISLLTCDPIVPEQFGRLQRVAVCVTAQT